MSTALKIYAELMKQSKDIFKERLYTDALEQMLMAGAFEEGRLRGALEHIAFYDQWHGDEGEQCMHEFGESCGGAEFCMERHAAAALRVPSLEEAS